MDESPISINDILRADFQKQAEAEAAAPPAPPDGPGGGSTPPAAPAPPPAPVSEPAPARPAVDPEARMAKIVAAQQQLRAQQDAWKREQVMADQERSELAEYRALKARAKEDPVGIAEHFGYKPDEYAATLVDKGSMTPDRRKLMQQDQELREMKAWRQQVEQRDQQREAESAYNTVVNSLRQTAEAAGEAYDLVRRGNNWNLVLQKIQEHARTTGAYGDPEILPFEQALEMAEQELLDKQLAPYLESPKIRSKYGAPPSAPQSAPSVPPAARQRGTNANLRAASYPPKVTSEAEGYEAAGKLLFKQFSFGR